MSEELAVRMLGITKRFPGVIANDNVDFELRTGEIHVLLGENGAGKTTLMNILIGLYTKDSGEIYVWGRKVEILSPQDALRLGIYMVPQTPKLVRSMTVLENIVIGLKKAGIILPTRRAKKWIEDIAKSYYVLVDIDAPVYRLSASEQKRVEILKALVRHAKILIFDEITATLSPSEKADMFKFMRKFARSGGSIVFVTHKIGEVFEIGDRVTIMRKGKVVGTFDVSEVTADRLTELMFGRRIVVDVPHERAIPRDVALKVEDLWVEDDGFQSVRGISFSLRFGEILGVAGIAGNGQRELIEAIVGIRKPSRGRIYVNTNGKLMDITDKPTGWRIKNGLSYIPEDRIRYGIVPGMSVAENLLLGFQGCGEIVNSFVIRWDYVRSWADNIIRRYGIVAPSVDAPVRHLSGGNIQKLIVARELERKPRIIVAFNPTLGLDVRSMKYVWEILVRMKQKGVAILLVSEDLDEIFRLSDRILVMSEGEVRGIFDREEADINIVGRLMSRAK